jgi:type II secretory pathway component PulK
MRTRSTAGRGGFVLVVVLVISCALGVLLGQFAVSTLTDLELNRARARAVQLRAAAESGVALARAMLAADLRQRPAVDSPKDAWAQGPMVVRIGEAAVTVTIRDENAKISLPHLMKSWGGDDARRLTQALRLFTQEAPGEFGIGADDLRRWVVANQFRLDLPEQAAARPLFQVKAAAAGPGKRPEDYVTVWTDGELNVNTAPAECLRYAWGDRAGQFVGELVKRRARTPFTAAEEVLALPGASTALRLPGAMRLSTTSTVFSIEVEAVAGPSRFCEQAVVTRAQPGVPVLFRRAVGDVRVGGKPRQMTADDFLHGGVPRAGGAS